LRLTSSLLPLQGALLSIRQAIPPANRALDILEVIPFEYSSPKTLDFSRNPDEPLEVSVKNLSFSYRASDSLTLSNVSIQIPRGSQAAFIGVSGAGKSTLADIVLGLLSPSEGEVLVGGMNPTELIRNKPGLVGYVPQKPGMISGTIKQNIAIGFNENEIDNTRLSQAVADAHLTDLIESLPMGLKTDIGKRKDELSGGQLQRIGLARALYSQPKLLVMDEATSALDAESENEINKALDEMRGRVTVILIAHRLNTIQRSNVVFLIEDGKVSASGTFHDLTRNNETVRNLANLMSLDLDEEDGTVKS
jgi:ATP-binding cassette subfamily C protein